MPVDLDSYNTVPERIAEFRAKHPNGTLQSKILFTPGDIPGWVVEARAYRSPDDICPGVGLAFEPVPGKTSFTRDSELQNAETSAWGRAIVAVGAADAKKGIASAEDIRNRRGEEPGDQGTKAPSPDPSAVVLREEKRKASEEKRTSDSPEGFGEGPEGESETSAPTPPVEDAAPGGVGASSQDETHTHGDWSDTKPDSAAKLRPGFLRCTRTRNGKRCDYIAKRSEVAA